MPNFTEGEWYSEDGFIFSKQANKNVMIADFVPLESDARLMAKSKKMYELLSDWEDDIGTRQAEGANYNPGTLNVLDRTRAILSGIDNE